MTYSKFGSISARMLSISAIAMLCGAVEAGTVVVPNGAPTIQAAINAANSGDTILISDGTYTGRGNYNIDFGGKAITLRSVNGPAVTIIDIQATQQNQHTGFTFHTQETSASVVEGLTIKHGYQFNGGAIQAVNNSNPTIRNCVMTENTVDCWGAAIYFSGASPAITDCVFKNNHSGDDGGAIFGLSGSPVISNCLMANNEGTSTGGAITIFGDGSPKLINSTIVGNHANWGAAIYANNLQVINSIIWGNNGQQQIYSWQENVEVKYSIVQGGFIGTGNLMIAPQFVNATAGDYHLLKTSPGVDGGDPLMFVAPGTVDMDGDPRKFGVRIDMGIDEFRKTGDVNGDHSVNVDDLLSVINGWGPANNNPADLTRNGFINVDDLLMVIGNWG